MQHVPIAACLLHTRPRSLGARRERLPRDRRCTASCSRGYAIRAQDRCLFPGSRDAYIRAARATRLPCNECPAFHQARGVWLDDHFAWHARHRWLLPASYQCSYSGWCGWTSLQLLGLPVDSACEQIVERDHVINPRSLLCLPDLCHGAHCVDSAGALCTKHRSKCDK